MTLKRQGPTRGVCLVKVSVLELTAWMSWTILYIAQLTKVSLVFLFKLSSPSLAQKIQFGYDCLWAVHRLLFFIVIFKVDRRVRPQDCSYDFLIVVRETGKKYTLPVGTWNGR